MNKIWNLNNCQKNTALIDDRGFSLTYGDLNAECLSLAKKILQRSLVFCLCENSIGSVLGYIGLINNGIVPALLNANIEEELLERLLNFYKPSYLWIPAEQKEHFAQFIHIYSTYGYALLKTNYSDSHTIHHDLALLLTTSGSTGSPKFVRQSCENVVHNAKAIADYLELDENERPITTLPMNYTYGLSIINSHLLVGATILLTEKTMMQKEFWNFFKEQHATSFGGVPYTYEILDKLRFYNMDLPSLKTMTQAGGKLAPELHKKFAAYAEQNNKKFIVMYGQCEATARMGYLPHHMAIEKKGSMGIPIPGGSFKLIDADSNEITEPHTTGELVYEGKNVTMGYAENAADLIKGDERGGVLHTGDMAQFDKDGYYYIVGRKARFLKIYGNRVNLDEIDRMIKSEFETEAASAGVDDHLHVFITTDDIAPEVKNFLTKKTGLNSAAFKITVLGEIPKNDAGKILYRELAKYYE